LAFHAACARDFGDVVAYRLGHLRCLQFNDPDLIEEVLVSQNRHFEKFFPIRLLRPVLGNGLLTAEGDAWLRRRRLIQPAFHRHNLDNYGAIMADCASRMVANWKENETLALDAEMMWLTLSIITRTLFGTDGGTAADAVAAAMDQVQEAFASRVGSALPLPSWLPTPSRDRFRRSVRCLDTALYELIRRRRAASRDGRNDLLALLLEARDDSGGLSDLEIRDEAMTLYLAGHETTALALAWSCHLLSLHLAEQECLADEVREVLGGQPPGVADLPRLRRTEWVVLEALRLYPPAYAFGREAVVDCNVGGYHVARGTTVFLVPCVVHRDGRFFDDPSAFRPERWADGLAERLPRYAYFPFGGGPRICIGSQFALMEAVLVLAAVVQQFRLTPAAGPEVRPWPGVTLRPRPGIRVVLTRR
jgi:cytochrome P450